MEPINNVNKTNYQNVTSETIVEKNDSVLVKAPVKIKKKTLKDRFVNTFVGNPETIKEYIKNDVVVPSVKIAILDIVGGSLARAFNLPRNPFSGYNAQGYGSFNQMSQSLLGGGLLPGLNSLTSLGKPVTQYNKPTTIYSAPVHTFDDILFQTRSDAELVLARLVGNISTFGKASIADLYSAVGRQHTFTDIDYGWRSLAGVNIVPIGREGYKITFPPTEIIK